MTCVRFIKLDPNATTPKRATKTSAGFDLCALEDTLILPGVGNVVVRTGISMQLVDVGTYGRIAIRSGLSVNHHLSVSAGVIDFDYPGEIKVLVYCNKTHKVVACQYDSNSNYLKEDCTGYVIKKGERFAQLIVEKHDPRDCELVEEWPREHGNHGGFGSTGKD